VYLALAVLAVAGAAVAGAISIRSAAKSLANLVRDAAFLTEVNVPMHYDSDAVVELRFMEKVDDC
jgi:hypothetical protein